MSEEFINPSQPKNRFLYYLWREDDLQNTLHVHKYPIIYSNKLVTYIKTPEKKDLTEIYNYNIVETANEATTNMAKGNYCYQWCFENPGHLPDERALLAIKLERKKAIAKELFSLEREKEILDTTIKNNLRKMDDIVASIKEAKDRLDKIDSEVRLDYIVED